MAANSESNAGDLRNKIAQIIQWKAGTRRAPHKPLLLLLMIARIQNGGSRLVLFEEIEPKLRDALTTFGHVRKSIRPEYPFWHLKGDKFWEVQGTEEIVLRRNSANPTAKELRDKKAAAGFLDPYYRVLRTSASLQKDLIHDILNRHFPTSVHEDIADFLHLSLKNRRPGSEQVDFRQKVLAAYDGTCAVSNFSVHMERVAFGVEAAHLLWPQAGGRDVISNAVAMTSLHRKLFHLGVFTIDESYRVRISPRARGNNGFMEIVGNFEGKKISVPINSADRPNAESLAWHRQEVFRS